MDAIATVLAASRNARGSLSPKLKDKHVQRLRALRQRLQALKQLRTWPAPERAEDNNNIGGGGGDDGRGDSSVGKYVDGISNGEQRIDDGREGTLIEDSESASVEEVAGDADHRRAPRVQSRNANVGRDSTASDGEENPSEGLGAGSTDQSEPSAGTGAWGEGRGVESGHSSGGFEAVDGVAQGWGRDQTVRQRNSSGGPGDNSDHFFNTNIDDDGDDGTNTLKGDNRGGTGHHHPRVNESQSTSSRHRDKTVGKVGDDTGDVKAFEAPLRDGRENGELDNKPGAASPTPLPSRSAAQEPTEEKAADFDEVVSSSEESPLIRGSDSPGRKVANDILRTTHGVSNDRASIERRVDDIGEPESMGIIEDKPKGNQIKGRTDNGERLEGVREGVRRTSGAIEGRDQGKSGNEEGAGGTSTINAAQGAAGELGKDGFANDGMDSALHRVNGRVAADGSSESHGSGAGGGTSGQSMPVGGRSADDSAAAEGVGQPIGHGVDRPNEVPGGMLQEEARTDAKGQKKPAGKGMGHKSTEGEAQKHQIGGDVAAGESSGRDNFNGSNDLHRSDNEEFDNSGGNQHGGSGVGHDKADGVSTRTQPGGRSSNDISTRRESSEGGPVPTANGDHERDDASAGGAIGAQGDSTSGGAFVPIGGSLDGDAKEGIIMSKTSHEAMSRWKSSSPSAPGAGGVLPVNPGEGSLEEDGSSTVSSISGGQWGRPAAKSGRKRSAGVVRRQERVEGAEEGVARRGGPGRRRNTRAGAGDGASVGAGSDGASSATKRSSASRRQVQ